MQQRALARAHLADHRNQLALLHRQVQSCNEVQGLRYQSINQSMIQGAESSDERNPPTPQVFRKYMIGGPITDRGGAPPSCCRGRSSLGAGLPYAPPYRTREVGPWLLPIPVHVRVRHRDHVVVCKGINRSIFPYRTPSPSIDTVLPPAHYRIPTVHLLSTADESMLAGLSSSATRNSFRRRFETITCANQSIALP